MAKILLVEDNARDVEITLANLRNSGVDASVQVVRDGEQALDYLHRRKEFALRSAEGPDVLLLDVKMPKVSGLEVLRAMKSDPVLRNIPVILLTSSREEQDLAAAYQWGAEGYLIKPVRPEQLAATIAAVTGGAISASR